MTAHETHQDANLTPADAGVASVPTADTAAVLASHRRIDAARFDGALPEWVCAQCQAWWRGDPETGGCDAVLLARRVGLLEGLLGDVHADLYDTMSPRLNRRIMAALAAVEAV
jgi:hypothetical protein